MFTQASKIVCIGRNYADHAKELNNPIPDEPVIFIKPASCAVALKHNTIAIHPQHETHYEAELVVEIGNTLTQAQPSACLAAITRIGLGLDLTRRNLQNALKSKGHPWERAKAFDASAPISELINISDISPNTPIDWGAFTFSLHINQQLAQLGNTANMLFGMGDLLANISETFTLYRGDLVMTGTPAGVGKLHDADAFTLCLRYQNQDILNNSAIIQAI